jgi:hypothetical protein
MSFWSDKNLEPKRSFRFILSINGGVTPGIKKYLVKSVKKPSFSLGEASHQYLNHTFNFPGRLTWDPVEFSIVDVVDTDSNGSKELMEIIEASGYALPTSENVVNTISKKASVEALGKVIIRTIDAEGDAVEEWSLHNAFLTRVDLGQLDYETDGMLNISVTLKYDYASLNLMDGTKIPRGASGAN